MGNSFFGVFLFGDALWLVSSTTTQKNKRMSVRKRLLFRTLIFLGVFVIVGTVSVGTTPVAHAGSTWDWLLQGVTSAGSDLIRAALRLILAGEGYLVTGAAVLFSWVLEPTFFYDIMQNTLLYSWWQMVRDVFNMFFIGALLLTAFSTIFQVERFHYTKTLLQIVLMALLVNFSFPISRFIIDFFNRMMYFLINMSGLKGGEDLLTVYLNNSHLVDALAPSSADTSFLLMAVIFYFFFMIALLVLAFLYLIRTLVLILLVIFSPLGFSGRIIPGVDKYASQWWSWLFTYGSFGPFAMLMIVISLSMVKAIGVDTNLSARFSEIANHMTSSRPTHQTAEVLAYMSIPIILMFYAIGIGKKMSIAGADIAGKYADKALGWGKKVALRGTGAAVAVGTLGAAPYVRSVAQSSYKAYQEGRKQAVADKEYRRGAIGRGLSNVQDKLSQARIASPLSHNARLDAKKREMASEKKSLDTQVERYKGANLSSDDLRGRLMEKKDTAAAVVLGERGQIRDMETFKRALEVTKGNYGASEKVLTGTNAELMNNPEAFKLAIENEMTDEGIAKKITEKVGPKTFMDQKDADGNVTTTGASAYEAAMKTKTFENVDVQKDLQKKMKEKGSVNVAIKYDLKQGVNEGDVYKKYLQKMSAKEWTSQSDDFYGNQGVRGYAETVVQRNPQLSVEALKMASREGSSEAAVEFWSNINSRRPVREGQGRKNVPESKQSNTPQSPPIIQSGEPNDADKAGWRQRLQDGNS